VSDVFHFLDEPLLSFGAGQLAEDPRDGLALFGPSDQRSHLGDNVVIGTAAGIELWSNWVTALNSPAACANIARQRPWPPYPGFDVAFGARWPSPAKSYVLDAAKLHAAAHKADRRERAYSVANMYLEPLQQIAMLDAKPAVAICVVPDEVHQNCRPKSFVKSTSDTPRTADQREFLRDALKDHHVGQGRMFDDQDASFGSVLPNLEQYGLSPDFRRQLKARMMAHEMPVQIVLESTLTITEQVRLGEPGTNPLSDRLWNFGTALFYKWDSNPGRPHGRETECVTSGLRIAKSSGLKALRAALPRCFWIAETALSSWENLVPGIPRSVMSSISRPLPPRSCYVARLRPTANKTAGR